MVFFIGAAVGEFPEDGCGMPVLVFLLLYHLDPVVGDAHCHAVVETDTSVVKLDGKAGHAAHFLRNCDGVAVHLMDENVGEGEIDDGVGVLIAVVIVGISSEGFSKTVVVYSLKFNGYIRTSSPLPLNSVITSDDKNLELLPVT